MKKQIIILSLGAIFFSSVTNAQTNTFPPSGDTGIGETNPDAKLDINLGSSYLSRTSGLRVIAPQYALSDGPSDNNNVSLLEVRRIENSNLGTIIHTPFIITNNRNATNDNVINNNIGVGIANPRSRFHVNNGRIHVTGNNDFGGPMVLFGGSQTVAPAGQWGIEYIPSLNGNTSGLNFWKPSGSTNGNNGGGFGNYYMFLSDGGNIGINNGQPASRLHMTGGRLTIDGGNIDDTWNTWNTRIASPLNSAWVTTTPNSEGDYMSMGMTESGWYFGFSPNAIGDTGTNIKYAFSVHRDGLLTAREIKVNTNGWADFVFEENYDLRPIKEVKAFIEKNNHLPDVPSAKDVAANGIQVGEMNKILLRKIEELTLYVIEQSENIDTLKRANEELRLEIESLKIKSK